MRAFVICGAIAAIFLLESAQALPADEPTNLGVQITAAIDLQREAIFTGAVPVDRVFLLPLSFDRYRLPTDPEGTPVSAVGDRSATYTIDIPADFEIQPATEVRAAGYRGRSTTCTSGCRVDIPHGTLGVAALMLLRARTPGTYTLTLRLTSTSNPDPDPGNDSYTKQIRFAAAAVTAGKATAKPAVPIQGRPYSLTLPLTRSGAQVKPDSVRCSANVGTRSLKGAPSRLLGRARCSWKVPRGAAGKMLRAKLVATASGKTFSALRAARVH
ncbi:MAG TPA: hypothetical protein VFL41_09385 [Gaiellaceae bacterium]|nr:hypothetical protein [Gaiellaceae bacterium]